MPATDPAGGGLCPGVSRVQGTFGVADAPLSVPWTDHRRRAMRGFANGDCCYRWCAPLPVKPALDMMGKELTCSETFPVGYECFDVRSGPSRIPASPMFPECPAALAGVGGQRAGAMGGAYFSASMTGATRSQQGQPSACCYSFCQTVPGVSYE